MARRAVRSIAAAIRQGTFKPDPARIAQDEDYWTRVAANYRVTDKVVNLEAGYWGMMAAPGAEEYARHLERVNREKAATRRRTADRSFA